MTQPFVDVAVRRVRARLPLSRFDLGDLSSAAEVRLAVERTLQLPAGTLSGCAVLRIGRGLWIRVPLVVRLREARAALSGVVRHTLRALLAPVRGVASVVARLADLWLAAVERALARPVGAVARGLTASVEVVARALMAAGRPLVAVAVVVARAVSLAVTLPLATLVRGVRHVAEAVEAVVRRVSEAVGAVVGRCVASVAAVVRRVSEAVGAVVGRWMVAVVRRVATPVLRAAGCALVVVAMLARVIVVVAEAVAHITHRVREAVDAQVRRVRSLHAAARAAAARAVAPLRRPVRRAVALARAWVFGVVDRIVRGRDAGARELDHRRALFDALLSSPHRNLTGLHPVHADVCRRDPIFYAHLAAWYAARGEGRDHLEMFVIVLTTSAHAEHREVGLALLRTLPPYQVGRVVDFIRGRTVRRGRATVREGLFRNPPRALRTEVERFLREREASPDAFDGAVLVARAALKRLYTTLHIRPSARAQATLFDRDPPADGRVAALRRAVQTTDADERARIVAEARLPYRVAASLVPASSEVLVERMSAAEVVNHMALLERRGALADATTRRTVERRLQEAVTSRRVSTMRAARAAEAVDEAWAVRLRELTEQRVKAHGRLRQATAVLVDASASMDVALDVGRRIAAMLAVAADAPLHVYAFNERARRIVPATADMSGWIEAFDGIAAEGATSPGAAVLALLRGGHAVEQIVLITDQRENASPRFVPALRLYRRRLGSRDLRVVFVNVSAHVDTLERQCGRLRMEVASWRFQGDDYAIPDLLPLIVAPTRTQLVIDILGTALPARRAG